MTNVLIVEDEPAISDMERDFLEGAGYNPFIAENSEEALHMMRSEKIDAVILDVTLPGEDGFSLCRKLREITNVPILFAAARTEDSDIVRGLGLGACRTSRYPHCTSFHCVDASRYRFGNEQWSSDLTS